MVRVHVPHERRQANPTGLGRLAAEGKTVEMKPPAAPGSRSVLPIPRRSKPSLTTYDAKDPDTSFPPIDAAASARRVRRTCWSSCSTTSASARRARSAARAPTPNAERLAARGLKFNRFHTTALCAPTRQALLTGRNHHAVGMGAITEIATSAPGLQLGAPQQRCAAGRDVEAQRLLHRAVRQVPRGAGVADQPDGAVRPVADRQRVRVLLRVPRRRDQPVLPGALRGHHADRAAEDAGGGLPLHRGHDRQGDRLGPPAEGR